MLFWLVVIIFLIGLYLILFSIYGREKRGGSKLSYWAYYKGGYAGILTCIVSGIVILIMCFILIYQYTGADARMRRDRETYLSLRYKIEMEYYNGEYTQQTKDIVDDVQEWNEYVAYHKGLQKDFWIGIFYPNVYDTLDRIPLRGDLFIWN